MLIICPIFQQAQNTQQINPVLQKQKKRPDAKEQLAIKYYHDKEYEKAAELFDQLYNEKPSNYIYNYYFNSLVAIKNYKKAEKLTSKQIKFNRGNPRYIIDQAYVIDLGGNTKKANRILEKLISDLPLERNKILQITNSLQAKGYSKIAIKVYEKARNQPGKNNSYGYELGDAYLYNGDYSRMFDSYLDHIQYVPTEIQRVKNKLQYVMRMDVNNNLSDLLKTKLLQRSQSEPQNVQYSDLLMWYSLQTKDFDMAFRQARAIDLNFGNGDNKMLELAKIAYSNYNYEISAKAFGYIKNKKEQTPFYAISYSGYYLSLVKQTEENLSATKKDYEELEKEGFSAINELGINNYTSDIILNLAHIEANKLGKNEQAIEMLELALKNPMIDKKNEAKLKIELADILVANDKIWDATLLYSQVENDMKNEPIGHDAKLRNAKVFYYVGEFDWASARLDVLKSATSKLISNDAIELSLFIQNMREEDTMGFTLRKFAGADLYAYQGKYDSALMLLDKVEKETFSYLSNEYALYKKAGIYTSLKEFDKADSTYNTLITKYPESVKADNAIYKRALILQQQGNITEAKVLYLRLMTDYPDSIYAGRARKNYRLLESDS